MQVERSQIRILGIDPCSGGFGFAVLDTPEFIVDWGVATVWGKETDAFMARAESIIGRYLPDAIVFPAPADYSARPNLRKIASRLVRLTAKRGIPVRLVYKVSLKNVFPMERTKHDRAVSLANVFPDLREHLPTKRRPWESEDLRANIFDALALVLAATCSGR